MCVATAIIVGGIAAAGGSVASAAIQSRAAGKAAKAQETAGDKALAFQREQYQQARQEFDPYQQAGYGALGRLNLEAGIGRPEFRPGQPQPAAPAAFGSAARQLGAPVGLPPPVLPPPTSSSVLDAAPAPRTVGPGPARLFQQTSAAPPAAPPAAPGGAAPGLGQVVPAAPPIAPQGGPEAVLWTLQAPDGTTKQLSPEAAQPFILKGARRVA